MAAAAFTSCASGTFFVCETTVILAVNIRHAPTHNTALVPQRTQHTLDSRDVQWISFAITEVMTQNPRIFLGGSMPARRELSTSYLLLTAANAPVPLRPLRTGMPALDSIIETRTLAPRTTAARAKPFRILRTTEIDAYEASKEAV